MKNVKVYNSRKIKRAKIVRNVAGGLVVVAILGSAASCGINKLFDKIENFETPAVIVAEDIEIPSNEVETGEDLSDLISDLDDNDKELGKHPGHSKFPTEKPGSNDNNHSHNNNNNNNNTNGLPTTNNNTGYIAPNPNAPGFPTAAEPMPTYIPTNHGWDGTTNQTTIPQQEINDAIAQTPEHIGDYDETTNYIDPNAINQGNDGNLYATSEDANNADLIGTTIVTSYEADDPLYYATDGSAFYSERERDEWNEYLSSSNENQEQSYYVDPDGNFWNSAADYLAWASSNTNEQTANNETYAYSAESSYFISPEGEYWDSEESYNLYQEILNEGKAKPRR